MISDTPVAHPPDALHPDSPQSHDETPFTEKSRVAPDPHAAESLDFPVCDRPSECPAPARRWPQELHIFTSTFITIFLAELGDKTQVTTLLMTAESHSPWVVFAGASLALVLTSLLGVWLGCWLARRVAPRTLEVAAGLLLLTIALLLMVDVVQGG